MEIGNPHKLIDYETMLISLTLIDNFNEKLLKWLFINNNHDYPSVGPEACNLHDIYFLQ